MNTSNTIKLNKSIQKKYDDLTTKSSKIRFLDSLNYSRSEISRFMKIRYQHVRNVLITPIKNPNKFS